MASAFKSMKKAFRAAERAAHDTLVYDKDGRAPSASVSHGMVVFDDFEGKNFFRSFVLDEMIGQRCGKVFTANVLGAPSRAPSYAVKRVTRWGLKERKKQALLTEVEVLHELSHPNVQEIYQFYPNDPHYYFVVMEHLTGGELFDRICTKASYTEREARDVCKLLVEAVKYCHDKKIVHRDLQPCNVLLTSPSDNASIKLSEFGMACSIADGPVVTECKTHEFLAPEILLGKPHGTSVDMWSLGLIAYILIGGRHPFYHRDTTKMFVRIAAGDYEFRDKEWSDTSDGAKDFIEQLLMVDASRRMTAAQAMTHPWLLATADSLATHGINLEELKIFNAKRKLLAAVRVVRRKGMVEKAVIAQVLAGRQLFSSVATHDFASTFSIGDKLGEGAFATVFRAIPLRADQMPSGEHMAPCYAVKRIKREGLEDIDEQSVLDEVDILRQLRHPNVVNIYEFYQDDPAYYYMVLELMEGGELFDRIVKKTFYNEREARDLCRILLDAMKYMHGQGVVHRDLKPENLLLSSLTDDTSIRLADFGFACSVLDGFVSQQCGTPGYMAPEILRGEQYGTSVDMWSIGVIIYIILAGYPPFHDSNQTRLFRKIRAGHYKFDSEYWHEVSSEAKDLIRRLLNVDPTKRMTAAEAVEHPWLSVQDQNLSDNNLHQGLQKLKVFNATRKLRAAIQSVLLAERFAKLQLQVH